MIFKDFLVIQNCLKTFKMKVETKIMIPSNRTPLQPSSLSLEEQLVGALNLGHEEGQLNKFPWLKLRCLLPSMMHGMEAECFTDQWSMVKAAPKLSAKPSQ